jgi:hypothetical protein
MKLYLFAQTGNYGEFIEIVSAENAEQAWNISKARTNGWDNDPQELITTQIPSTIFEGGGDNG